MSWFQAALAQAATTLQALVEDDDGSDLDSADGEEAFSDEDRAFLALAFGTCSLLARRHPWHVVTARAASLTRAGS